MLVKTMKSENAHILLSTRNGLELEGSAEKGGSIVWRKSVCLALSKLEEPLDSDSRGAGVG